MEPNTNSTTKKIIVISVSILLVVAAVYFLFLRDTTLSQELIIDEFGNPVAAHVVGQDLIDLLRELESVTLNDSLFRDPAFIALTDFAQTLNEEPRGRPNPFSAI